MCGIVGVASAARSRFVLDDVRAMADRIVHRGPDDGGFHDGGAAIIGMRRLSIIDLEGGHQPIHNADKTIWVVNNGEIYNFRQLRRELEARGFRFATNSDTEVIVHAYEAWGDDFLDRIDGMFAVALWDSRRQCLILARDRLGIKPLYFWPYDGGFAFASEVKAFLPLQGFSPAPDPAAMLDYLGIGYAVAPSSIFAGVEKIPPGHRLIWDGGQPDIRPYWALPTAVDDTLSYDDWVERIGAELRRSVSDHLVADVPVGSFLSGGIDSSAICALMKEVSDDELSTYSIGYAGSRVADYYNELPYARIVADRLGSTHREIAVQPDVAALLPKLLYHVEEPISDSAITTTYLVSQLAAETVKVIMSGVGGDELFAGYTRYLGDHYLRRYRRIPSIFRRTVLPGLARFLPSGRQNRMMDLARYAKRFVRADQLSWRERYAYYLAIADRDALGELLGVEALGPQHGLERIAASETSSDEQLRVMRIDAQTQLPECLLLLTDKLTMASSIECRVPFLDTKLTEMAATIPARHKLPNGRLKGVLKDALRGVLPDDIIDRRKRGFGAPVGSWFKSELAGLRAHLLDRATLARRGLVNPDAVGRICALHDANRADYTDLLLVLMNMEVWARLFCDNRSVDDVSGELSAIRPAA
ncbi:MAG: asparagine synthase (glutamine-hydrolyzing) [Pseudomonadota bacterium]